MKTLLAIAVLLLTVAATTRTGNGQSLEITGMTGSYAYMNGAHKMTALPINGYFRSTPWFTQWVNGWDRVFVATMPGGTHMPNTLQAGPRWITALVAKDTPEYPKVIAVWMWSDDRWSVNLDIDNGKPRPMRNRLVFDGSIGKGYITVK